MSKRILTKTTIVMQMFSKKASIFAHKETNASLTKKCYKHSLYYLAHPLPRKLCLIVSHPVVLNDIIKVVIFHITESRGIKFELRQSVTETVRHKPKKS